MDLLINKLAQKSARVDKKERDEAFESIRSILASDRKFSRVDFRKVWRGILYSFWLTDKLPVQVDYANRISALIHSSSDLEQTLLLMKMFYFELGFQWKSIDKHRLSKYLSLIRSFSRESFKYILSNPLQEEEEEEEKEKEDDEEETKRKQEIVIERIQKYNIMMRSEALSLTNFSGSGLQIQLICVFFSELKKVTMSLPITWLIELLYPYLYLFASTINISIQKNVEERLLEPLILDTEIELPRDQWKRIKDFFHQRTIEGRVRNIGKCYEWVKKIEEKIGVDEKVEGEEEVDILKSIEDELNQLQEKQIPILQKPQEEQEQENNNSNNNNNNNEQEKLEKKLAEKRQRRKKKKQRKRRLKKRKRLEETEQVVKTEVASLEAPMKKRKLD